MSALSVLKRLLKIDRSLDYQAINQGRVLALLSEQQSSADIQDHEFKVFSQWGEDGIIQFLTRNLDIPNRTFIEFGIETFTESNCRFLMMKDNWQGFVIDGSEAHIKELQGSYYYWQYMLQAERAFITRDNISGLLAKSGFDRNVGILSIDLDGVDYHIYEALSEWTPAILIFEYNGVFGSKLPVSVPYSDSFVRTEVHYSHQYWGASLAAFQCLADARGYALVGVNSTGSNAFFVRRDLLNDRVKEVGLAESFRQATFRDSRDPNGKLSFPRKEERRGPIADLPLLNVATGQMLRVGDLPSEDADS